MSKALVVDDSRTVRMILRRVLSNLGYDVIEAGDGREALQSLESNASSVNLVLADWNMPVMNGLDMVRQMRTRPELDAVKVVMVTTEAEFGHVTDALTAGANEYVMKPFTREILQAKLALLSESPQAPVQ
jgi:two-component system chemotaxis response regulator CheY